MENFKDIPNMFPLQVSRSGVVRNKINGYIYKPVFNRKGYLHVHTSYKMKRVGSSIHRMVALTYIPNPDNKPEVNHIDCDKTNNCVENLEWVTQKENTAHAILNKLHVNPAYRCGEQIESSKITEEMAHKICKELEIKQTKISIARRLGVSEFIVVDISCGNTWKHISKDYKILRKTNRKYTDDVVEQVCQLLAEGKTSSEIYLQIPEASSSLLYNLRNKLCYKNIYLKYFPEY